jgi:antitoxin CptB
LDTPNTIPPKLHWACRRGMLELDVLLGNFLREAYLTLPPEAQQHFVYLLKCEDQDLFNWLTGKETAPEPILCDMVEKVRRHAKTRHSASSL